MQKFQDELKELFRPTTRCFKGLSILLTIWGIASLLICGIVPTIILVHNPLPSQVNFIDSSTNGQGEQIDPLIMAQSRFVETFNSTGNFTVDPSLTDVRDKAELLRWITLGIGSSFLILAVINFFMFSRYKKQEEDIEVEQDQREVAYK